MVTGFQINGKIAGGPPIVPLMLDHVDPTTYPIITNKDQKQALALFLGVHIAGRTCGIASQNMCDTLPMELVTSVPGMLASVGKAQNSASQFLTFTGGTTGAPKMILRSPASWIYSFERMGVGPKDRVACFGELSHSIALYSALEAIHMGAEFHPMSEISIQRWAHSLAETEITCLYATPTQLRLLMALAPPAIDCLTKLFIGGGSVDNALKIGCRNIFPKAKIQAFYGAAESSFVAISDENTPDGAIGKPFDGVQITIDKRNRILAKGPMLFDGYAIPPLVPAETVGRSVCVGDLGELRDGYLYLLGRDDRVVTIADVSVPLDDIENQLQRHPNVLHAAVLTRKDRLRGLGMYAMVKTRDGTDYLGEILNQAHVPTAGKFRRIIRIADWPTTAGGKTDYKALEAVLNKHA